MELVDTAAGSRFLLEAGNTSCRLLAQREVIESLLNPSAQALQKRFDVTFVPEDYYPDSTYESMATAASKKLISDFHSWMFEKERIPQQ